MEKNVRIQSVHAFKWYGFWSVNTLYDFGSPNISSRENWICDNDNWCGGRFSVVLFDFFWFVCHFFTIWFKSSLVDYCGKYFTRWLSLINNKFRNEQLIRSNVCHMTYSIHTLLVQKPKFSYFSLTPFVLKSFGILKSNLLQKNSILRSKITVCSMFFLRISKLFFKIQRMRSHLEKLSINSKIIIKTRYFN